MAAGCHRGRGHSEIQLSFFSTGIRFKDVVLETYNPYAFVCAFSPLKLFLRPFTASPWRITDKKKYGQPSEIFGRCGVRRLLRFRAQLTGESYYSTSWYMYSVLKKEPEYPYPLYRSTGTRFKNIYFWYGFWYGLKKLFLKHTTRTHLFAPFHRWNCFCGPLPPAPDVSQTKKNTGSLQRYSEGGAGAGAGCGCVFVHN